MLGVVLWSDASDRKAVIWCEDQGDLAYVTGADNVLQAGDFFDAGDLIQFDMETYQSMRLASNARLVEEQAKPDLPRVLMGSVHIEVAPAQSANVIPFSRAGCARALRGGSKEKEACRAVSATT